MASDPELLAELLSEVQKFTSRSQRSEIKKAFHLAADAHKFQKRLSGEPYILHPTKVSILLSKFHRGYEAVCAALLHDVLEDSNVSYDYLEKKFGSAITHLVDGVTKISKLKTRSSLDQQAINIRKMILATVKDPRVILIKLADKLHNMQTLEFHKPEKREKIAKEVLDIYAPLAGRLGIYKIKSALEDLALYHLDQEAYQTIKSEIAEKRLEREKRIQVTSAILIRHLKENKIKAEVHGRSKHFYSIYNKIKISSKSFSEIYDLTGLRILVNSKQDCYGAIGIIHTLWNPIPGRFKDYIAVPKRNGYQSLHTTVIAHDGKAVEVQVRTFDMHRVAEYGIATHWAYKESKKLTNEENPSEMIEALANLDAESSEFIEELKVNLTGDEVYVFTPKGEIISMQRGATVLDFAFRIHTELGLKCAGAKINDRLVSIRTQVRSGDQVQIVTNPGVGPSLNWLKFLQTTHAKAKLRAWFRKQEILVEASKPEKIPKPVKGASPALEKLSEQTTANIPQIAKKQTQRTVVWEGEKNFETKFAKCCAPLPGDAIMGFITKGNGISVHKVECPSLRSLLSNKETKDRVITLKWSGFYETFSVNISVSGEDRPQLFLDMVRSITQSGASILEAKANTVDSKIQNSFNVEVDSLNHLEHILFDLRKVQGVHRAVRILTNRKLKADTQN